MQHRNLHRTSHRTPHRTQSGAQIMCEALLRAGVQTLFGIPGGPILPFFNALEEYPDLRLVFCRHEQGAGHAAEGYARASGRLGVCVATSGPGATNLVTPIADAMMDSTPLLAITGQVDVELLGSDAFQETDILGITAPITKYSYRVSAADQLAQVFCEAIHIATSGRPGPVLIDVTKNAQVGQTVPQWDPPLRDHIASHPAQYVERDTGDLLLKMLDAQRPLLMVGAGVIMAGATAELRRLAEALQVPVVTTLHGIGAFPRVHPLSLGMAGLHGAQHVNRAIQECDVLLNIGGRFDDRITGPVDTFAPEATIIHVDIDPTEIGKNVPTDIAVVADAREALSTLLSALPPAAELSALHQRAHQWLERIHADAEMVQIPPDGSGPLTPYPLYRTLTETFEQLGPYRVVTDVGQHQMWAAQWMDFSRPRTHITSGGAGTMGFAVPAGVGAAIACPSERIWVITGDGGMHMALSELSTAMQEQLDNLCVIVINNHSLGLIRQWRQLNRANPSVPVALHNPDFARLAESYGWTGITVTQQEQVVRVLQQATTITGPVLLDCQIAVDANVWPWAKPGQPIDEAFTPETITPETITPETITPERPTTKEAFA